MQARSSLGVDQLGLTVELPPAGKKGAVVSKVAPKGPAEAAGIKMGDRIIEINAKPIATPVELVRDCCNQALPDVVSLSYDRGGDTLTAKVSGLAAAVQAAGAISLDPLGVTVKRARSAGGGAEVMSVDADSPAAKGGVQVGDAITKVGGTATASLADLAAVCCQAVQPPSAEVEVMRAGKPTKLSVSFGAPKDTAP
jgi:S1-C subfamily serine protease